MNIEQGLIGLLTDVFKKEPELKKVAQTALERGGDISLNRAKIQEFVRRHLGTQNELSMVTVDGFVIEITINGYWTITQSDINSAARKALELSAST